MSDSSLEKPTDKTGSAPDRLSVADRDISDGLEEAATKEALAVREKRSQLVSDSGKFGLTDDSQHEQQTPATRQESDASTGYTLDAPRDESVYDNNDAMLSSSGDACGTDHAYTPANFRDIGTWQAQHYEKMSVEEIRVAGGHVHFKLTNPFEQSLGLLGPTITIDRNLTYGLYGEKDNIALDPITGITYDGKAVNKIEIKYDEIIMWCGSEAIKVSGRTEADAMQGLFTPQRLRDAVHESVR